MLASATGPWWAATAPLTLRHRWPTLGTSWIVHRHILEVIAGRGDEGVLSVERFAIKQPSALAAEVDYLITVKGYRWASDTLLVP